MVDRRALGFAEAVEGAFAFLVAFGFRLVDSQAAFVRFEGADLCIDVFHGRLSYEIDLGFGRAGQGASPLSYSMVEILNAVDSGPSDKGDKVPGFSG